MKKIKAHQQILFLGILFSALFSEAKPAFTKVMMVVLENTNYAAAIAQPFLSDLTKKGALLENISAETHPSQGNYIAMLAGDTYGINDDKNIDLDIKHIGDMLDAKGLTWKAYVEDYPGNCFLGATSAKFARKHVAFLSFKNVTTNPDRCKNIVNASQMDLDIKSNSLPNYSIYIPNLTNDGHNTNVTFADKYMSKKFGPLLQNQNFMDQMLFIVTFDESESKGSNQIYTVLLGNDVIAGSQSKKAYTHYSILKTIETVWNLGTLAHKDQSALLISDVLK